MTQYILYAVLFTVQCCTLPAEEDPILAEMNARRDALQRLGLVSFAAECRATKWAAPWMPSKWRWTNISDERERKRVEASRAFGLELLVQIDKNSFNARTKKDADKDTEEAGFWFDLAEWCVATRGYGNLMIARRCADIGNLPLGRLATVESVRNEILVALEQRAKTSWDSPEDRRRILNDEAQAEVFPVAKDQEPSLRKFFGGGVVMRQEQRDPSVRQEIRTLFGSEPPPKLTVLPLQGLLFFKDEESRPNSTTITGWDLKQHGFIVNGGIQASGFRPIQFLINYRKALGHFPKPPYKQSPFYKGLEGAFDEEWRAIAKQYPNLPIQTGGGAWSAYDRITKGKVADYDYAITHPRNNDDPK